MASTTRWLVNTAFAGISFTAANLNSLATGGGALGTTVVSNSTILDVYGDFSFIVTVGGTTTAASYVQLFILPLNQDAATYGDGYASSTTTIPGANYLRGNAFVKVGVTTGNTVTGTFTGIVLPPSDFKVAFANQLGIALSSTAALTLQYKGYDENLNA